VVQVRTAVVTAVIEKYELIKATVAMEVAVPATAAGATAEAAAEAAAAATGQLLLLV
jgi:hypothetical protein